MIATTCSKYNEWEVSITHDWPVTSLMRLPDLLHLVITLAAVDECAANTTSDAIVPHPDAILTQPVIHCDTASDASSVIQWCTWVHTELLWMLVAHFCSLNASVPNTQCPTLNAQLQHTLRHAGLRSQHSEGMTKLCDRRHPTTHGTVPWCECDSVM